MSRPERGAPTPHLAHPGARSGPVLKEECKRGMLRPRMRAKKLRTLDLDVLTEEATVDCHDVEEQRQYTLCGCDHRPMSVCHSEPRRLQCRKYRITL